MTTFDEQYCRDQLYQAVGIIQATQRRDLEAARELMNGHKDDLAGLILGLANQAATLAEGFAAATNQSLEECFDKLRRASLG